MSSISPSGLATFIGSRDFRSPSVSVSGFSFAGAATGADSGARGEYNSGGKNRHLAGFGGIPASMSNALRLLFLGGLLAAAGSSRADYAAGQEAYSIGDYETALAEWTPLAEQGHAGSQFGLGSLYANGWGVPLDDAKALDWYQRAANQGHAEAQYSIGVMYQNGWGVEQSDAEALKWIQQAADGGFPPAHRTLGDMYAGGFGVTPDPVQACKWFATGEALGDSESSFDRSELEMNMQAPDIETASELAKSWLDDFRTRHPDYDWPDE